MWYVVRPHNALPSGTAAAEIMGILKHCGHRRNSRNRMKIVVDSNKDSRMNPKPTTCPAP